MDLSIIILNYSSKNLVKYCIKNVKKTVHDLNYEIIVVDNGSGDGLEKMLEDNYPDVKFIQTGANLGFAKGNNIGIKQAQGEHIMILNPDITVREGAIRTLVDYMRQNPQVGIAGPQLLNPNGTVQESCRRFLTLKGVLLRRTFLGLTKWGRKYLDWYLMRDIDHSQIQEVDWLMGACLIVRKKDLEKVGGFDERFFLYVEDMEWCRRFKEFGYKVMYVPTAKMVHLHQQASATTPWGFLKLNRIVRWHIASYLKYRLKYFGNKKPNIT